ncbi:MAG: guanylate kinase [Candidatus Pelagibacter bacterium]|jgi:guanylate kinase|nr:guanylate kinase [Candidatus Pelagibacter bacterium]
MSSSKEGIMVILSSPSGSGKTTLVKKISSKNNYSISISHTTRTPRTNEVNGKEYFFVGEEEFKKLINNNEFLEYAKVFNNYYGSSKKSVLDNLKKGKNIIFDIDWQGTEQIKQKKLNYQLITFFILPPSKEELFDRLSNRDLKDKSIVEQRMKQFDEDVLHWKNYDFVVVNDDLEACYNQIINLIETKLNKTKSNYDQNLIEDHIKNLT